MEIKQSGDLLQQAAAIRSYTLHLLEELESAYAAASANAEGEAVAARLNGILEKAKELASAGEAWAAELEHKDSVVQALNNLQI